MDTTANNSLGFTVIEMIVAIGIFTLVAVAAVSALASVIDANERSSSLAQANNSLDFSLQTMVREIRNGFAYGCDASDGSVTETCNNSEEFGFINTDRDKVGYKRNGNDQIVRTINGKDEIITPSQVTVTHLQFDVIGADSKQQQSRVIITARVEASSGDNSETVNLQTTATQRLLYTPSP